MDTTTYNTVVGVFDSRVQADRAVSELFRAGFSDSQVGLVHRQVTDLDADQTTNDEVENTGLGAATGAAAGASVGALVGWGVLSGMIPVVGPALFAGTLGVLASNAAAGAGVAGIVGALTGWGVSDEHAKDYESQVAAGRAIVTVTAGARFAEARAILREHGATSRDPAFTS